MFRRFRFWRSGGRPFEKVLIANRGEIAVRIIRALREMGIGSVAVFSEADREGLHVRLADEAYSVGPPHPLESYLDVGRILEVARRARVQAIHPGYGFLAENASFARAVELAGFVFIGPDPACLETIRHKVRAREAARRAGVPVIPGVTDVTRENLAEKAKEVGFPLLIKAVAAGGGRGVRKVLRARDLAARFERSLREARWSFGEQELYLERCLKRPRHVAVQVAADRHGNRIHLFEHEASVQRRHQKLLEEAPSPAVDEKLRRRLVRAALAVAREVGLTNLGSVEFLLDGDRKFYFLGVNGRIQVEHPVVEMVTGLDLVRLQLELAAGAKLPVAQEDVALSHHALEVRVTAEDPSRGFMPSGGTVRDLELPGGSSVRVDSGIHVGQEISLYYDSLLLKIVTWGRDREEALSRMDRALAEFHLDGVVTGAPQLRRFLGYKPFVTGDYDVNVLDRFLKSRTGGEAEELENVVTAAAALITYERLQRGPGAALDGFTTPPPGEAWVQAARRAAQRWGLWP